MGLLDDAIREHLDLKRARGGDPAEIERMEREALGPVRREPTIGTVRREVLDERRPTMYEHGYDDDVRELEELQDLGYHDSTAPHAHPHDVDHDPRDVQHDPRHRYAEPDFQQDDQRFAAEHHEREQPRRRFLRRHRESPAPKPSGLDQGFHDDEPPFESHELLPDQEAVSGHDPLERPESIEYDDRTELLEEAGDDDAAGPGGPPHLRFDHPPKRPRFTAEPPSTRPADEATPGSEPAEEPKDQLEPQATTEFDVQRHIAETRHLPDETVPTREHRSSPGEHPSVAEDKHADDGEHADDAAADEDVLEETPEFLQDTPEHDRLWFEQRPPKDFDFDG